MPATPSLLKLIGLLKLMLGLKILIIPEPQADISHPNYDSHRGMNVRSHCIHSQLALFLFMDGATHSQDGFPLLNLPSLETPPWTCQRFISCSSWPPIWTIKSMICSLIDKVIGHWLTYNLDVHACIVRLDSNGQNPYTIYIFMVIPSAEVTATDFSLTGS